MTKAEQPQINPLNLAVVIGTEIEVFSFSSVDLASKFKADAHLPLGSTILVTKGDVGLRHVAKSFLREILDMTKTSGGTGSLIEQTYQALISMAKPFQKGHDDKVPRLAYR